MNLRFLERSSRKILDLPLDQIQPDPEQPRRDFQDLDQLAASISTLGLQQPLLVRKLPEGDYRIVAGERRWRAARQAELQSLPCLLIPEDQARDLGLLRALQLTENLQRADLSIMEIAQGLQAVLDHLSVSKSELASRLGKSRAFVHRHLALLRAEGLPATALAQGRLRCAETFRIFAKLPVPDQQELMDRATAEDRCIARADVMLSQLRHDEGGNAAQMHASSGENRAVAGLSRSNDTPRPSTKPAQDIDPRPPGTSKPRSRRIRVALEQHQILWLLQQLGAQPPEDSEQLLPTLMQCLP